MELAFTVYISYSPKDEQTVNSLYSILKQSGVNIYTFETTSVRDLRTKPLSENVKDHIHASDYVIVLLTENSIESANVFFEIGMAKAFAKPIILIVEPEIQIPEDINDLPYVVLDRDKPNLVLEQIRRLSLRLKSEKDKGNQILGVLFLLFALGFFSYLVSDER